jgi:hypothetical protein
MLDRKLASAVPVNRLFMVMGSPERGSISENTTGASSSDKIHTTTIEIRNSTAGSGNLLPTFSMVLRNRSIIGVFLSL